MRHYIAKRNSESSAQTLCGQSINGTTNITAFTADHKEQTDCPKCLQMYEAWIETGDIARVDGGGK